MGRRNDHCYPLRNHLNVRDAHTIKGTILDVSISNKTTISAVREAVVAAILGRPRTDLGNLPSAFGNQDSLFVVRLSTVWRFAFKKDGSGKVVLDSKGYPVDSGDATKRQVLVVGAVVRKSGYQDPRLRTGFLVDDLSGGTGLARASAVLSGECDVGTIVKLPTADIIWVVDESPSVRTYRDRAVQNANNFFSRALASGLDFRMGVTGVNGTATGLAGKFCSKVSTDAADNGGTDRFLLPSEQRIFSACMKSPPGNPTNEYGLISAKEAVKRHLPRSASSSTAIRKGATLVVIVVSDEPSSVVLSALGTCGTGPCQCPLSTTYQAKVDTAIKPFYDYFSGVADPEATAMFHYIGKPCHHSCSINTIPGYGYQSLARRLGGQSMDICQQNLGSSLQVIIDSVVGSASPISFSYIPIPGSIAVNLDGQNIKRSRTNGFDYRDNARRLVFINVKYRKGSNVVYGYSRWSAVGPRGP